MNKVAIVGDLHLGVSPNSATKFDTMLASQIRFLEDQLIPELIRRGISELILTGDVFDQRRKTDVLISQYVEGYFEKKLAGFKVIVIQGNHDTYYKEDLSVTSLSVIWSKKNVKVINAITPMTFGDKKVLMVPWLTVKSEPVFTGNLDKIKGKYDYCIGHFEICGFEYEAGTVSINGMNPIDFFDTFKHTLSGHYHTASEKESGGSIIQYVGTPYQLTFADCGVKKGFWIYDFDTGEREFIENTTSNKFIRINSIEELNSYDTFENCYVNLIYNETMTREELFLLEKLISDKKPLILKSSVRAITNIDELLNDDVECEELFEDFSNAISGEDMIEITRVYMKAEPFNDSDLVIELMNEIKSKKFG